MREGEKKQILCAAGGNWTPDASLFQRLFWTISSSTWEVGRLYKVIVGTHLLVSTPSLEHLYIPLRLGSELSLLK